MVAIAIGLAWGSYTIGIWGYCLVKSYDVTFPNLFRGTWPGAQVAMKAPSGGHKLGTITNSTSVTDPGQQNSQLGQ